MDATEPVSAADSPSPSSASALWRAITRFDASKIAPWLALRNSIGILFPLIAGVAAGNMGPGLIVSTGALNVSFSDGGDSYRERGRRMLASSAIVAVAVFVGAVSARNGVLAVALAAGWAFASGMLVAIGTKAADIGVVSLVTLVVFSAQPLAPERAACAGLLAFAGGLLQTALALALWPVRRYRPERRALGNLYLELSRAAALTVRRSEAPPASTQTTEAQNAVTGLGGDHSVTADRYRSLLNQAERVRLSMLILARLRRRIEREADGERTAEILDRFLSICSTLLGGIANSLGTGSPETNEPDRLSELDEIVERWRRMVTSSAPAAAMIADARFQMDAIGGQLRSAAELASHSTPAGSDAFEERESRQPWTLQVSGRIATLRANLTLESAACRHAIRLAACLAVGDTLGRSLDWRRSYWLPMTIAIVLKPDFTATFSRGVLRLAGTFGGLAIATVLFHALPLSTATQIALIGVSFFVVRCFGPANYGVFVTAVSALVVLLVALSGVAPNQVIAARALNTAVGGALALLAYWLWPTWERTHIQETLALLLDAYRDYFRAVCQGYLDPAGSFEKERNRTRQAGRLARSNLEAAVDRLAAEPGASAAALEELSSMLASSHRVVHSFMALEAGLSNREPVPARGAFRQFVNDVERTLYFLGAKLRGSKILPGDLPALRESHRQLIKSGDSPTESHDLVNVETDRLTNSVNTLGEQICGWVEEEPTR
ncbi:MAG: FUSC family protein [Bryobacteraceae bacterium]